ncbi:polyamine oxidase 5 [Perilla frutescens var. frutescens]|nr:polyamine oxidase 5 [Perilla frutescens var. frutescens]
MASKKPRIVIVGAGMAGLTAAHRLYTSTTSDELFDLHVVEGGTRIGGRINSDEFCGDQVELGATWIHGIHGSPVYKIAQDRSLLHSHHPYECMDGLPSDPVTVSEGGHELPPSIVDPISKLFKNLMDFIQGKVHDDNLNLLSSDQILKHCSKNFNAGDLSVGSFLRNGLEGYWSSLTGEEKVGRRFGHWRRKSLEEAVFAMHENTQRSYTAADDLRRLDYDAERDYVMFPGEEITIARGYSSVIECLASDLPTGMIQLGRKVERIEWQLLDNQDAGKRQENERSPIWSSNKPVKLHFVDGTTLSADHVIVTVSLGVLKRGIRQDYSMFDPPLPCFKRKAISRLGFGVVNKVFLQLKQSHHHLLKFPLLQMVFHKPDSELRNPTIPHWIRRTSALYPIYSDSRVVLSWFTGQEAIQLESLTDEQIMKGFSATVLNLISYRLKNSNCINGVDDYEFDKVLRTQWGTNPLFLGSYSYVAVGSSVADMDALSEPLPENNHSGGAPPLQVLFAGEATHATHYSTTHGAYFSGLREANRLLQHYNVSGGA